MQNFQRATAAEQIEMIDAEIVNHAGELIPIEATLIPIIRNGGVIGVQGAARDITERKRTEDALRESRDLLNATQRLTKAGGWEWDVTRQRMMWADETYRIHGMAPGDLPDGSPELMAQSLACYDEADRPVVLAAFERCIAQAAPYDIECPLTRMDGRRIWIRTVAAPVVEDGRVVKVIGNILDITAREQAETQLQEYADHMEQMVDEKVQQLERARAKAIQMDKMASLGEMATGVAHELNQPLTAITFEADFLKTVASQLRASERSIEETAEFLIETGEKLEGDIERCRRIVDHLRTFGRIAQEPPQPIDLNQPISDCFILADARLRHSEVDVRLDLVDDLPPILADPHKLEQVFLNLISNAEYAMKKQSEREPKPDYHKVLEITTAVEGEHVVARVRDNGCGIRPEDQKRLFNPFFTTKPEGEGTGLGLSISYRIVTDCDGEIEFETVVGAGTTFTLKFPISS